MAEHLHEIDIKIRELKTLHEVLTHLVEHCAGDARPHCPIIDNLADPKQSGPKSGTKFH